jgi:hypothetical protein
VVPDPQQRKTWARVTKLWCALLRTTAVHLTDFGVSRPARSDDRERRGEIVTERERPSDKTRAAERDDAEVQPGADRQPTAEEERLAEQHDVDREVAQHAEEMYERGAKQKGEGRV